MVSLGPFSTNNDQNQSDYRSEFLIILQIGITDADR